MNKLKMSAIKYLRFTVVLVITAVIFFYIFSRVNIASVLSSVKNADFVLVLLCLGISFVCNIVITTYRFKMILEKLGQVITFDESLIIKMGGKSVMSILPFRSGELSRLLYLKRLKGMTYSDSLFSIGVEYLLNFFVLCFLCIGGIVLYYFQVEGQHQFSKLGLTIGCLVPICLVKLDCARSIRTKVREVWGILTIDLIQNLKGIFTDQKIILCSFLYMGGEFICLFLLAKSLSVHIPVYAILVLTSLVIIGSHLLVTIAGLGTRELTVTLCFAAYASPEQLLSLGILLSFVEVVFPLCIGFLFVTKFTNRLALSISGENSEHN